MDSELAHLAPLARIMDTDRPGAESEPPYDYPAYESTVLRAPKKPLILLPEELHDVSGPVFGHDTVGELDNDLTRQHAADPLGERIIVTGRVLESNGRPVRNTLIEIW